MHHKFFSLIVIITLAVSLVGCAGIGQKINRLSISMHKDEVRTLIGNNFVAKGSKVNADGNVLDLWEITDPKTKETYQIFFLNDKVSQWGSSEDLNSFPELHAPTYKSKE
ncbi:MAG: hypothetical protein KKD05_00790 [Candidatus Omnitrophica bacterium]|nr:hypothetical protein [Candidatus Omnitrophota bacterium]